MGQIKLIVALIMIGLFTIALMGFAINFADDNASPAELHLDYDPEFSSLYDDTRTEAEGFKDESESTYSSILNTTIAPGSQTPQSAAPFALTPTNAFGVVTNIFYVAYQKVFGTGSGFGIFLTTFLGVIVFMIGLYIYKTLRGLPD